MIKIYNGYPTIVTRDMLTLAHVNYYPINAVECVAEVVSFSLLVLSVTPISVQNHLFDLG